MLNGVAKPNNVPDVEERRALDAIINGKTVSTANLKDQAFRRAVIAYSSGAEYPDLNQIENSESRRIFKQIKVVSNG